MPKQTLKFDAETTDFIGTVLENDDKLNLKMLRACLNNITNFESIRDEINDWLEYNGYSIEDLDPDED